jgi:OOP family OmpA-OmpF porin
MITAVVTSATALLTASLAALSLGTLLPADQPPVLPPGSGQISGSVTSYSTQGSVIGYSLRGAVTSLATLHRSGRTTTLTLGTDVLFDFGSATLDPQARSVLSGRLKSIPRRAKVTITGYTDSVGSPAGNLTLSRRRAAAVAAAATTARPDLTVSATGRGESNPVAPNSAGGQDNPPGRAKNRRVELRWS